MKTKNQNTTPSECDCNTGEYGHIHCKKDQSTPRPWKVECLTPNNVWINSIADERGPMPVAKALNGENDIHDAQLIVRAVNRDHAFGALLKACKVAEEALRKLEDIYPEHCTGKTLNAHGVLKDAIALVEGGAK